MVAEDSADTLSARTREIRNTPRLTEIRCHPQEILQGTSRLLLPHVPVPPTSVPVDSA